jgi:hypothetical protein
MKISTINEVANPSDTDLGDMEVGVEDGDFLYKFIDPRHDDVIYRVAFMKESTPHGLTYSREILAVNPGKTISIGLTHQKINETGFERHSKTGKGNFAFIYSKLMACVIDYFATRGNNPPFVTFSGYTRDMDSVYEKIMERLNKKYPGKAYFPYSTGVYVSSDTVYQIEDQSVKMGILNKISKQSGLNKAEIERIKAVKRSRDQDFQGHYF